MPDKEFVLKPCPFCGDNEAPLVVVRRGKDGWRDRFLVLCDCEHGGCGGSSGWYHYEPEAVGAWNRRATADDVEPKRRWIPVTERLPKPVTAQNRRKTKPVLLYSPKGGFYVGWYFGEDYRGHHIFANRTSKDSLQYITTKVTHWMPIGEEPKEDA